MSAQDAEGKQSFEEVTESESEKDMKIPKRLMKSLWDQQHQPGVRRRPLTREWKPKRNQSKMNHSRIRFTDRNKEETDERCPEISHTKIE